MIVVDTNVIVYLLVEGAHSEAAQLVYRKDSDWIAPFLWRSEFCNVLATYMRREELSLLQACQLMQEAETLMGGRSYQIPSDLVLDLASRSGCSAYDCEYAALALDMDLSLVTSDQKLIESFPQLVVPLSKFAE